MAKVLVTGASGFVGQALCPFLKEKGMLIKAALRRQPDQYPYEYAVVQDISDKEEWLQALDGVEIVIHLAAQAHGVKQGRYSKRQQDVCNLFNVNVTSTKALVQASYEAAVKHFIYLSSIKVNGEVTHTKPFVEEDVPVPIDEYGESKLQAEEIIKAYCQDNKMSYTILRPPLIYGPKVKGNFSDLLALSASKLPLPFSALNNKRSLIYIENLLDIIYLALMSSKARNETFLLCDGQDLSVQELITSMRNIMKLPTNLWYCPLVILELIFKILKKQQAFLRLSSSLQVNNQKIRSYLGWQPRFSIDQGLEETVKWFFSSKKQNF